MPSTHYDPDVAPDAGEWLSLPGTERIRLIKNHHVASRAVAGGMKAHAALHAAVEEHIARGHGPCQRAIARLQAEGLSRHEAVHAIGAVMHRFSRELGPGQTEGHRRSHQSRLGAAIEALHAVRGLAGPRGEPRLR